MGAGKYGGFENTVGGKKEINPNKQDIKYKTKIFSDPQTLINFSREKLKQNLPLGWKYTENKGHVHIKNEKGIYIIRIDPPDKVTKYTHMHIYDEYGNSLDIKGNIVSPKSKEAHIPYDK